MSKKNVVVVFVLFLLAGLASNAFAQSAYDFELTNDTGLVITSIYVSPSDEERWGDDVLGIDVLDDGGTVEIEFSPFADAELWDLKVVDEDGDEYVWVGLPLEGIYTLAISFDEDFEPVAVVNN